MEHAEIHSFHSAQDSMPKESRTSTSGQKGKLWAVLNSLTQENTEHKNTESTGTMNN